jgi:hypothetical protein
MRLAICTLVVAILASGCADGNGGGLPTIAWKAVPSSVQAGQQFYANYSIDKDGGFRSASQIDVWATAGEADPADRANYAIALDPTPSLDEPSPCPAETGTRYLGCDVNDLVELDAPGTYWVRARAVVDGLEAWSEAVRVVAT